jgi:PAS domain S-box-containing protein
MNDPNLTHRVESDPVLRLFLDSLTDQAVFALDPRGVITTWNEGCVRLKGYSPEEAIGQHFRMLYTEEDQERCHPERNLERAHEESVFHEEGPRVRRDGSHFIAEVSIYPIEEGGRLAGFGKIVKDVTVRKHHEREREKLSAELRAERTKLLSLVEDAPAFVALLDGRDLTFTYANDAYYRLIGRRPILGLSFAVALPEIAGQGYVEILQRVFDTGEPFFVRERPVVLRRALDNRLEERFVDISYHPSRDAEGTITGVLTHGVDVTEAVLTRRLVEGMNVALEVQVARRTEDLVSRNLELERFTYSVSHDMRTPMRAMASNAMMVVEDEGGRLSLEGRERLERIAKAAVNMGNLIDDLLRHARLGRRELVLQTVNLASLAEAVAGEMDAEYSGCQVSIDLDPELFVECDPHLVGIALQNLFENACKYRRKEAASAVHLGVQQLDGKRAYFVRDNGIGFDMSYVGKIFQPFERLHREEYAGTGIGLANVKRAIERHGGQVWAESEPGQGATFWFTLG